MMRHVLTTSVATLIIVTCATWGSASSAATMSAEKPTPTEPVPLQSFEKANAPEPDGSSDAVDAVGARPELYAGGYFDDQRRLHLMVTPDTPAQLKDELRSKVAPGGLVLETAEYTEGQLNDLVQLIASRAFLFTKAGVPVAMVGERPAANSVAMSTVGDVDEARKILDSFVPPGSPPVIIEHVAPPSAEQQKIQVNFAASSGRLAPTSGAPSGR